MITMIVVSKENRRASTLAHNNTFIRLTWYIDNTPLEATFQQIDFIHNTFRVLYFLKLFTTVAFTKITMAY